MGGSSEDLDTLVGTAGQLSALLPGPAGAIGAGAAALYGIGRSRQLKKRQQRQRMASLEAMDADKRRLEAEVENTNVPTAGDQLAISLQAKRAENERAMASSEVARQNIGGSPVGAARLNATQERLMGASDALTARLADLRDQRRQRAIYALPAISARKAELMQSLEDPGIAGSEALATGAAQEFGRAISPEGSPLGNWMANRRATRKSRAGGTGGAGGKGGIQPASPIRVAKVGTAPAASKGTGFRQAGY